MAAQDDNPLSIESLFSAFMSSKSEAMENITMRLDMEMIQVIKNWRQFARELNVAPELIERPHGTYSPTEQIFENLEVAKPELTIGTLKEVFTGIERNDLKELLDIAFPKPDDDKKEVRSALDKDLLRDIVKGLDILRGPTANWEDFAKQEKISVAKDKGELHRFGSSPLENPTAKLFQVLAKKKPQLKLGELYDALSSVSVKRVSTAHLLKVPNDPFWRNQRVTEVIKPDSPLLQKISDDLNREVTGTGNWKTLSRELGISNEDYDRFQKSGPKQSPTSAVLQKVVTLQSRITIREILQALENIERRDVIEVILGELGVRDLPRALRNLTVATPVEEDAAAILSDSSVSTGPSESDGPSGSTAPTDPASLTRSNGQESQPHVFLSYQWDIKAKVIELKEKLEQKRFTCWMDDDEMGPGDKLRGEIENGISHCKVFISCMTKKYCTSEMCNKEATLACERKKHIIPMLFEDLDRWPPQGPLGMVFSDTLYLRLPDGILNNEKFEELSKKIMELVQPQNK